MEINARRGTPGQSEHVIDTPEGRGVDVAHPHLSAVVAGVGFRHAPRDTGGARNEIELIAGGVLRDRKSTRLNSSHLGISYAVFCLKRITCRLPVPAFWHLATGNWLLPYNLPTC